MSWRDAIHVTRTLALDPSSHIAAAVMGWQYPVTREYLALKAVVDNDVTSKTEKRGQLQRVGAPWDKPRAHIGRTNLSPDATRALLKRARDGLIDGETVATII